MAAISAIGTVGAGSVVSFSAQHKHVNRNSTAADSVSSRGFFQGCKLECGLEKRFSRLTLIPLTVRAEEAETSDMEAVKPNAATPALKKKSRVSLKAGRKQRVTLRFLWLEKNIGIALDQVVPGHGTIPLSPYFFWPRKDAWEELKAKLDSKKWISRKRTIILLNQATDIINLWQQNASNQL